MAEVLSGCWCRSAEGRARARSASFLSWVTGGRSTHLRKTSCPPSEPAGILLPVAGRLIGGRGGSQALPKAECVFLVNGSRSGSAGSLRIGTCGFASVGLNKGWNERDFKKNKPFSFFPVKALWF